MSTVKAAAVQLSPVLYSREATVDKIVRRIHELGREGVQFAQLHERDVQPNSAAEHCAEHLLTTVA